MASVSKIAQYYSAFEPMSQSVFMWFMCARQGALSFISIPVPIFHGLNKICCCQTLLHARFNSPRREPWGSFLTFESSFLIPVCRRTKPPWPSVWESAFHLQSHPPCIYMANETQAACWALKPASAPPPQLSVCRGANQVDFCLSVQETRRGLALPVRKSWEYQHNQAETAALSVVNDV